MLKVNLKRIGLLLFLWLSQFAVSAQNPIGLSAIVNYARNDYNGGLQNRTITQDKNGILYFANSEGLLSFDGVHWKCYPLPNQTIVRSVAIGDDQRIYVGGQNEMGYFSPDKDGGLIFTSLKSLLAEKDRSFRDIWDIVAFKGQFFFRSQNHIFRVNRNTVTAYVPPLQWEFLGVCGNRLFAEDAKNGLYSFVNGKWIPVKEESAHIPGLGVTAMMQLNGDSTIVTTLKNGIFLLDAGGLRPFKFSGVDPFVNQRLLCAIVMDKQHIAIGTQLGGLYIIDGHGQVIENLSRREGLQNNTILGLFLDKEHNLWMGLDDGIDFNASNSAIKHIYPERLNEGTGYSAIVFNHSLYIGTSNWLYQLPVGQAKDLSTVNGTFRTVENTKGPVWGLFSVNNSLLMAHHEGGFEVKGDRAIPISTHPGYWNFVPLTSGPQGTQLLAGNYNGVDLISYQNHSFVSKGNIHFNESARFVIIQNHTAWVSHNYKGIYKIDLQSATKAAKLYTDHNGLPSVLKNRLFYIRSRMVAATAKGIYEYNDKKDVFEPSIYFKNIFGERDLRYLKEDKLGNVWFIEEKKLGVADFSGAVPHITEFPELDGKLVSDFENIYPLDEENIFVGAEKGFYHINYRQYKMNNNPLQVLISAVKSSGDADQLLNGGYRSPVKNQLPELISKQNSLHFEYAAPAFQLQSNITYSHYLKGFDKEWSAWSKKTEKDYTNVPEGNYTFQIKARSNLGAESVITSYSFIVLPPWYRTVWAYLVYGLLFSAFNYLFYRWLQRKFKLQKLRYEEEQKRLNYLHQLEIDRSEKEIIALKNEKLESEILGKNSELASIAMHLLQKGELLTKIREELVGLRKSDNDMPSEELKRLIRILSQESKMDKDWDQFAAYFDTTHSDFLKELQKDHPLLSPHELKLCAYLKMNLSSKEIAQLLNISVRGVEISRYRLRKKLALPKEMNLHHYFTKFSMPDKDTAL